MAFGGTFILLWASAVEYSWAAVDSPEIIPAPADAIPAPVGAEVAPVGIPMPAPPIEPAAGAAPPTVFPAGVTDPETAPI